MRLLILYLYEPSQNFKWKCIHSLRESSYNTLWESRYALVWYAEIPTYQHDSISRSKQIGALWGSISIFVAGNENITNLLSHCWCSIRSCIKTKTSHYPFIIIRVQNVHSHYRSLLSCIAGSISTTLRGRRRLPSHPTWSISEPIKIHLRSSLDAFHLGGYIMHQICYIDYCRC